MKTGDYIYKGIFALSLLCVAAVLAVGIHYGWRAFVADTFIVPSDSMQPTLMPGDKVKVDKLIFGARIYKSLDFTDGRLECWRTRGRRGLRPNDIIVFNYPINDGKIGFKINYVYVKRCVALPGDTISFVHSRPVNNNYHGTIGVPDMQQQLESIPDDQLPWGVMWPILTGDPRLGWSAKNIGPLYVPRCGDIIRMDDWRKADIYRPAIEFETRKPLTWDGEWNVCLSGEKPLPYYRFQKNYYFVCGDHAANSRDSRYWGFVPEEYIVGVVSEVVESIDRTTGRERKERAGLNLLYPQSTQTNENETV